MHSSRGISKNQPFSAGPAFWSLGRSSKNEEGQKKKTLTIDSHFFLTKTQHEVFEWEVVEEFR